MMRRLVSGVLPLQMDGWRRAATLARRTANLRGSQGRRWLAVVMASLALTTVIMGASALTAPSAQAEGSGLDQLPPPLLEAKLTDSNSLYYATSAELTALKDFENQAIQNTLSDHGLPASDADAVQTWGRTDAEAELWGLLENAITTPAASRTADQQAAVTWLSQVVYREGILGGYDVGLEYVKWAGLDQGQYHTLATTYYNDIATGVSYTDARTNLENFMSQWPQTYNSSSASTSTGGYCVYQPPAPYQSEYKYNISGSNAPAECYQEGAYVCEAGCTPPIPTTDQFEKWGEADANNTIVSSPEFSQTAGAIAYGLEGGAVAASVAAGIGASIALSSVMAGTAFQAAVFPFASVPLYTFGTGGALAVGDFGAVAAAGAGAIVGAVLLFIVGTTIEVMNLVNVTSTQTNVTNYMLGVPANSYDPASLLNTTNGAGELYSLFVAATLPPPPPASDTTAPTFPAVNCLGYTTDASGYTVDCLDPPPAPAPNPETDPIFMVTPLNGTATPQSTITWDDFHDGTTTDTNTAYLDGAWFVNTETQSDGTHAQVMDTDGVSRSLTQTLNIEYTDWSGVEQVASLFYAGPNKGYEFITVNQQSSTVAFNPATCATDKTCVVSNTIQYENDNGQMSATVIAPPLPKISDSLAITLPEGSPTSLTATASSPINSPLTYAWQIQDKPLPTGTITICGTLSQPEPCPPPTVTVSGNPATYTFPTSGSFAVKLIVTDADGRYTTDSFTLHISDIAPSLSLAAPCNPFLVQLLCGVYTEPTGTQTTLVGAIGHVGAEDVESLDINWGDGAPDNTISNTNCLGSAGICEGGEYIYPCGTINCVSGPTVSLLFSSVYQSNGLTELPFNATHTYAKPGVYTVTAKVTDQSGGVSVQTATEEVGPTTTTLTTSPNPSVWGQAVTLTASVSSPVSGNPSGTVSFSANGKTIAGCSAQPVDTTTETATCDATTLAVSASDSVTATYSGDSNFASSVSAPATQTVHQAATTTTLASSPNPSVWGQSVTVTATVAASAPGAGHPSGTVAFKDGGAAIGGCSAAPVNTATGAATCVTSALGVASHAITADYSGDGNFTGSSSAALTQLVNKASVTATVTSTNIAVTHGQPATFTAQVVAAAPGAGTPTGTVTFMDGATALGTTSLSVAGGVATASFATSGLAVGAHAITVVYSGDGNFLSGASPKLTQYINTDLSAYPSLPGGGYNLSNVNLGSGSFVGVNLTGSTLSNSRFVSAYFISANLSGVNMSDSNFTGANFTNANFTGANLTNANLKTANLTDATGLSSATITGVNWDGATCPDGTTASTHGGTCVGHF